MLHRTTDMRDYSQHIGLQSARRWSGMQAFAVEPFVTQRRHGLSEGGLWMLREVGFYYRCVVYT